MKKCVIILSKMNNQLIGAHVIQLLTIANMEMINKTDLLFCRYCFDHKYECYNCGLEDMLEGDEVRTFKIECGSTCELTNSEMSLFCKTC